MCVTLINTTYALTPSMKRFTEKQLIKTLN